MSEGLYSKPFYGRNLSLNMEKLSCVTLGNLSVSNMNRQDQQTLTVTNTLAYYGPELITSVKFYSSGPDNQISFGSQFYSASFTHPQPIIS
jgi:hypothetical protein